MALPYEDAVAPFFRGLVLGLHRRASLANRYGSPFWNYFGRLDVAIGNARNSATIFIKCSDYFLLTVS